MTINPENARVTLNNGVDITNYLDPDSLEFTKDGSATVAASVPPEEVDKFTEAMHSVGLTFENLDWSWMQELVSPQDELRFRIQERIEGRDPGEPINTKFWRVW